MAAQKTAVPSGNVEADAVAAIDGIDVATSVAHDLSMWGMFMQADIVVKLVILLLIAASVWSWKIIFEKLSRYRAIDKKMREFEDVIWSGRPLEQRYDEYKGRASFPLARVFVAGMYEWKNAQARMAEKRRNKQTDTRQLSMDIDEQPEQTSLKMSIRDRVLQAMDSTRNREIGVLEKHLGFLATVGSAAPFIGLFGTVWGIMRSFQAIAATQNTTLAVVAPGIAEALFATAIGLFAAIPAVIFYNKFAQHVANFSDRLDNFIDEFSAVINRELDKN